MASADVKLVGVFSLEFLSVADAGDIRGSCVDVNVGNVGVLEAETFLLCSRTFIVTPEDIVDHCDEGTSRICGVLTVLRSLVSLPR